MVQRKRLRPVGGVIVLVIAFGGGGSTAAFAGTSCTNFSSTIGRNGAAAYTNSQTKTTTDASGAFNPTFIGASRTISARMYRNSDGAQGTENTGVGAGQTVSLPNRFGNGQTVRTEMAGNPFNTTSTQVDGRWKSN